MKLRLLLMIRRTNKKTLLRQDEGFHTRTHSCTHTHPSHTETDPSVEVVVQEWPLSDLLSVP